GTAAYLCKKYGLTPRALCSIHVGELQQLLLRDGQTLLHTRNADEKDLALTAKITADSHAPDGDPRCVASGAPRPMQGEPYAWISQAPLPQSITLELAREQTVQQVRVTVQTPVDVPQYGYLPSPAFDGMITDLTISVLQGETWRTVADIRDNHTRLIVADFAPIRAKAVRITVRRALNCDRAIIPEIRIY
ncbi:MAG: hypothetical protein ACI4XW_00570, partial [Candidatus Spyradocola sp.]